MVARSSLPTCPDMLTESDFVDVGDDYGETTGVRSMGPPPLPTHASRPPAPLTTRREEARVWVMTMRFFVTALALTAWRALGLHARRLRVRLAEHREQLRAEWGRAQARARLRR